MGKHLLAVTKIAQIQSLFLVLAAMTLQSCFPNNVCSSFPQRLSEANRTDVELTDLSELNSLRGMNEAIDKINFCYGDTKYAKNEFQRSFERASIGNDGKYYIFFTFIGIEDYSLVFRANQNGVVEAVFSYSPIIGFLAPRIP